MGLRVLIQKLWLLVFPSLLLAASPSLAQSPTVVAVASGLNNPRGVAVMPDGRLLVVEAGRGDDEPGAAQGSGQISILADHNGDGDYDDVDERTPILERIPSYNSLSLFRTGHDEVFGGSDIILLDNGRIFFTQDDPFAIAGHVGTEGYYGDTGIFEVNVNVGDKTRLVKRRATLNSFAYDPQREQFFVAESGLNQLMVLTLTGEVVAEIPLPALAHGQQPVPAGVALDGNDVLVALLSGHVGDYYDTDLAFMPGDAKVVRVDPMTGTVTDEIVGLTTAVDVAVDLAGNIFVVEMTTAWPLRAMPYEFDLHDRQMPPDPGGYARFTGRVTLHPADGGEMVVLADGLDTPTNITYHDNQLFVSTGQGTPGRSVLAAGRVIPINGVIYRISNF